MADVSNFFVGQKFLVLEILQVFLRVKIPARLELDKISSFLDGHCLKRKKSIDIKGFRKYCFT